MTEQTDRSRGAQQRAIPARPRILTYLHSYEPGGVERIALRLVREWRAQGVDAPLYVGRREGAMIEDVGRDLDAITRPRTPRWISHFETAWMIATLPAVIRRERPDVLFCAGNTYAVVAAAMRLIFGRRCPPIVAKISNDLDRRERSWARRLSYHLWLVLFGRTVDLVVGMAEPARREIRERLGIADDRIAIIHDPALSQALIGLARRPSAVPRPHAEGRRFVAVGRLVPQKNIALMFRAFQRGAAPADTLTIIGDGPDRARLERLAERLRIAPQVHFLGYVPQPIAVLADYDVLLLSSVFEGVPAVVLEALAADLAIIATDCSRCMSTLLGQELGRLVPVGDETAMADAIRDARAGSGCPSLSLAQAERFTLEHAAESYLAAMRRVCRTDATPAPGPALDAGVAVGALAGDR